jgi:hypothetical protein
MDLNLIPLMAALTQNAKVSSKRSKTRCKKKKKKMLIFVTLRTNY